LTSIARRSQRAKWSSEAISIHVLDVPPIIPLDAPANLHIACYTYESVARGFKAL
jgi:hypothetical protein